MARSRRALVTTLAALTLGWAAEAQAARPTVVGPGDSIQAAIDAADPGDTLLVRGTHRENVVVQTDGLTLRGAGAELLPPPVPAAHACFDPAVEGEAVHGICVSGDLDFETGEVSHVVEGVTVSGFTVSGFTGSGLTAAAARETTFARNVLSGNGESGAAAIVSSRTRLLANRASGNAQAGLSVSLSPEADATVAGNLVEGSRFGISVLNAGPGRIVGNLVRGNCVGVFLLADGGGATGGWLVAADLIRRNTRACPADGDFPALSGAGVALVGATGTRLTGSVITGNAPTGESAVSGGVAVIASPGGTLPTDNRVRGNRVLRNDPDLLWDGSGTGNVFERNTCRTAEPPDLCG
jgi:hypothetical protein